MADNTSLVNLALQSFGDRTTLTAAQLEARSNNQAKQALLTFNNTRDSLLRLAPWDCALKTANLTYITSLPGTPENTSPATNLWQYGQPRPPWAYEYQYPVDCLRACWIIPGGQTGFAGGVPITNAVTGGAAVWNGGIIPFKVGIDQFKTIRTATPASGGTSYVVGEIITLAGVAAGELPIGAPAQLRVLTAPAGVVGTVEVITQVIDSTLPKGGSYFYFVDNPIAQGSTTGSGTGATFTLVSNQELGTTGALDDQRVILTNQQNAILVYVRQVTDPNVWDPMFQDAFVNALGGDICLALTGDKGLADICYGKANATILEARKADGNEGLTINNVTPDWIRGRGIAWADELISGPYSGFDWGGLYGVGS